MAVPSAIRCLLTLRIARAHLRPYDKLFRYGGEKFLICMLTADTTISLAKIERLRSEIAALSHTAEYGESFSTTVSNGIAPLTTDCSVEAVIKRANEALYAAKASGRNFSIVW